MILRDFFYCCEGLNACVIVLWSKNSKWPIVGIDNNNYLRQIFWNRSTIIVNNKVFD